jgi:anionic glutamate receptor
MNYRQLEKRILDRILSPSIYDSQIRPKGATTNVTEMDGPTKVMVNLYVRSFEKIDDVKMEFSVQITFRQQWNDNRLAFNNIGGKIKYLTMTERNRVWMPDTFFRNEKDGNFHDIIQPNLYVRVFPDGDVLYSIRVGIENSIPLVYEHKKKCSGLPNPGLTDESEAVSSGHTDLPPHHRQLWLDCKGPRVSLEGKEVLSF